LPAPVQQGAPSRSDREGICLASPACGGSSQLTGTLRTASGELREFGTAAQAAGQNTTRGLDAVEKKADTIGKTLGGLVAAAAVAFGVLIKRQVDLADEVGNTAERLGVTTEELSALGAAARLRSRRCAPCNLRRFPCGQWGRFARRHKVMHVSRSHSQPNPTRSCSRRSRGWRRSNTPSLYDRRG